MGKKWCLNLLHLCNIASYKISSSLNNYKNCSIHTVSLNIIIFPFIKKQNNCYSSLQVHSTLHTVTESSVTATGVDTRGMCHLFFIYISFNDVSDFYVCEYMCTQCNPETTELVLTLAVQTRMSISKKKQRFAEYGIM